MPPLPLTGSGLHGRALFGGNANAGVAQWVEQPICNRQVAGSSPIASSTEMLRRAGDRDQRRTGSGQMAERLMAADCKSAALTCYGGSNPSLPTPTREASRGGMPAALFPGVLSPRTPPRGKGARAHVAQLVEHVLGKDGVSSSNLLVGSISTQASRGSNSGVESQPSKLLVAGSNPVSRSTFVTRSIRTREISTFSQGCSSNWLERRSPKP